jgi:hypothetical protein
MLLVGCLSAAKIGLCNRALFTLGVAWSANQSAELHQGLVQFTRSALNWQRRHKFASALPTLFGSRARFDIDCDGIDACNHSSNITVDKWRTFGEGQRSNSARGVRSDSGN